MTDTYKSVPTEPTPEMMAAACLAVLAPASADMDLARRAAMIVLLHTPTDLTMNLEQLAAGIATMAPAYRAMIGAAPQKKPAPDLIRIDICLPNGMPDSEYITHDECRQRLAEFGNSHRQLMELKHLFAAVENAGPTS